MAMYRYVFGIDVGYQNLGIVIARLPATIRGKLKIIEQHILSAKTVDAKKRKKAKVSKSMDDLRRIAEQVDNLSEVCSTYTPAAIFTEMPLGSGKSSAAVKGMAFAAAFTMTFIKLRLADVPCHHFSPFDLKIGIGGSRDTPKEVIAEAVHEFWPQVEWTKRTSLGRKVQSFDIEDAAATLLLAPGTDTYKELYAESRGKLNIDGAHHK